MIARRPPELTDAPSPGDWEFFCQTASSIFVGMSDTCDNHSECSFPPRPPSSWGCRIPKKIYSERLRTQHTPSTTRRRNLQNPLVVFKNLSTTAPTTTNSFEGFIGDGSYAAGTPTDFARPPTLLPSAISNTRKPQHFSPTVGTTSFSTILPNGVLRGALVRGGG